MFVRKGLWCLMAHPGDDLLLLLEMSMHLMSLVHGLMERLGLFRDGSSELRDDGGFLCSELAHVFFSFGHVDLGTLTRSCFACLPLGRSYLSKSKCLCTCVCNLGFELAMANLHLN